LQRLLYSPLLNRRRKTLEQNAGNASTGTGTRSNGSRSDKQGSVPGSSAANSNYRLGARGSQTKASTSKNSFDDCLRYSAARYASDRHDVPPSTSNYSPESVFVI
jgi:hypothetical protein